MFYSLHNNIVPTTKLKPYKLIVLRMDYMGYSGHERHMMTRKKCIYQHVGDKIAGFNLANFFKVSI